MKATGQHICVFFVCVCYLTDFLFRWFIFSKIEVFIFKLLETNVCSVMYIVRLFMGSGSKVGTLHKLQINNNWLVYSLQSNWTYAYSLNTTINCPMNLTCNIRMSSKPPRWSNLVVKVNNVLTCISGTLTVCRVIVYCYNLWFI